MDWPQFAQQHQLRVVPMFLSFPHHVQIWLGRIWSRLSYNVTLALASCTHVFFQLKLFSKKLLPLLCARRVQSTLSRWPLALWHSADLCNIAQLRHFWTLHNFLCLTCCARSRAKAWSGNVHVMPALFLESKAFGASPASLRWSYTLHDSW